MAESFGGANDLPALPFAQPHPFAPPPALRALQATGPVHRIRTATGDQAWLVTGYREVRRLLADDRLGRAHPDPERAARTGESALFGGPLGSYDTERADHARMRSLLQPHFAPGRIRALRPRVEALATELLDTLESAGPPADLVPALAEPLPILVICELLGVPYQDREQFRGWAHAAGDTTDRARSEQGLRDLFGYGMRLVARKRQHPGEDVISRLCEQGLSDEEAAGMSMALLFAGHETTVVQIGLGAALLLHDAEWARWLRKDPSLVDGAVEEILRAPGKGGGGIPRYAREDFDLDGVKVRAGELVLLDNGAANHDPGTFPDADVFDPARDAGRHLTFGNGARYCIGAPLARLELRAVFAQLTVRFPGIRLAVPLEELRSREGQLTGGLTALPVVW